MRKSVKQYIKGYTVLSLYFAFLLLPIFWIVFSSFKEPNLIISSKMWPGIKGFTINNYLETLSREDFQTHMLNSFKFSTGTAVVTLLLSSLAAYASSRFRFKLGAPIFVVVLSQMLPPVLFLIPFFLLMLNMGLVDSFLGIVLTHTVLALPFSIWMLKGYFDSIPKELDEMAMVDGCNRIGALYKIIIPVSLPGLAVVAFFAFVVSWGDYLFVSVLSQSKATAVLTMLLQVFVTGGAGHRIEWEILTSATVIVLFPPVLLFAFLQKWFVAGLTAGSIKE